MKTDWTIIIPVLNEADSLEKLLNRLYELPLTERAEVLVVDGGSTDHTRDVFIESSQGRPQLYLVEAPKGKGLAIRIALSRAKGRYIAYMDGDMQYLPEDLPKLARAIERGNDLVVSQRRIVWPDDSARRLCSKVFSGVVSKQMLNLGVSDPQSGMKAFRATLLPKLHLTERYWGLDVQLIQQAKASGARIHEVDIRFVPRAVGVSKTGFVSTSLDLLRCAMMNLAPKKGGLLTPKKTSKRLKPPTKLYPSGRRRL